MTSVVVFPDPVAMARAWLLQHYKTTKITQSTPPGWDWNSNTLIRIIPGGSSSPRNVVRVDCDLIFEITDPDAMVASRVAREVMALMKAWPDTNHSVYWGFVVTGVRFDPDPNVKTPLYTFTVRMGFRGQQTELAV